MPSTVKKDQEGAAAAAGWLGVPKEDSSASRLDGRRSCKLFRSAENCKFSESDSSDGNGGESCENRKTGKSDSSDGNGGQSCENRKTGESDSSDDNGGQSCESRKTDKSDSSDGNGGSARRRKRGISSRWTTNRRSCKLFCNKKEETHLVEMDDEPALL